MPIRTSLRLVSFLTILALSIACPSGRVALADPPAVGIAERAPWTTSRIQGSPEPPLPLRDRARLPRRSSSTSASISPARRAATASSSSSRRARFTRSPTAPDVQGRRPGRGSGQGRSPASSRFTPLAFHPDFEKNRYCYVCYIKAADLEDGTHVARFRVNDTEPPTIDPSSETTIITWLSGGHNGCCLKFGPDGYLYISTGDGGPANPPDPLTSRTGPEQSALVHPADRRRPRRRREELPDSARQPVRLDEGRAGRDLGVRPAQPLADELRSARRATCGSATSAGSCGRCSTASSAAATTAGP